MCAFKVAQVGLFGDAISRLLANCRFRVLQFRFVNMSTLHPPIRQLPVKPVRTCPLQRSLA